MEIAAEIDLAGYRGGDTNAEANAKPRTISLVCIAGTNQWRIEHDWVQNALSAWHFDGTNVYSSSRITKAMSEEVRERIASASRLAMVPFDVEKSNVTIRIWPSLDGHPLGDPAVNIGWLAFCSGTYLKRDGRLIPLPVEELRHTRDRFAYTDKAETFDDDFGLPRTVNLFLSRELFVTSELEFDKEYFFSDRYTTGIERRAASLPEGIQTFHYVVIESTNLLG